MTNPGRAVPTLAFGVLAAALGFGLLAARPARAQILDTGANIEGFTVTGKGATSARPNRFEIDLEIAASSELSADVIVKYRDAKKRLNDAFAALKLKDVAITEKPLSIEQKGQVYNPYYMDMPPARKGKVEVQLSRKLVASGGGIRELDEEAVIQLVAKLLDVAQDAGGKVGASNEYNPYYGRYNMHNGLVRFILDDFEALQDKAYQSAIDDARARAGRLAKISGVTLGPVVGVREVFVSGDKGRNSNNYYYEMMMSADDEIPRRQVEASRFAEIPVRVELQVRFAVAKPGDAKPGDAKAANEDAKAGAPRQGGGQ